jgi:hypothetical protein
MRPRWRIVGVVETIQITMRSQMQHAPSPGASRTFQKQLWLVIAGITLICGSAWAQQAAKQSAAELYYSVLRFGAVSDGRTKNTAAIQRAIDTASAAGGGTVYFPAGRFLSGTLVLKSSVTLHLDNGAVLLGSTDTNDYPRHIPAFSSYSDTYVNQSLLYAEKVQNIAIEGSGTIDGQGGDAAFKCVPPNYRMQDRPYLIRFVECTNIRVIGVTLRDSAMWVQHYLACDNVALERLTIRSHCNNNNDAFDIDGCHDVRILGCTAESGDDAITLKSTGPRTCERITIANCVVSTPCSGIKMGTETTGGFRDITITGCVVRRPLWKGERSSEYTEGIGLQMVDGGVLERVTMSDITVEGAVAPIFVRLGNRARPFKTDAAKPGVGKLRDVVISNLIARGARHNGCIITGIPGHAIENFTLRDVRITFEGGGKLPDATRQVAELAEEYPGAWKFGRLPAYGLYVRHVNGLTLDNVQLDWEKPDYRPALICDDVRNLNVNNLQTTAVTGGAETMRLKDVSTVLIRGCIAPEGGVEFLNASGKLDGISVIGNDLHRASRAFSIPGDSNLRAFFETANRLPAAKQ